MNPLRRNKELAAIFLLCTLLFAFRVVTAKTNPITWDEPAYIFSAKNYVAWAGFTLQSFTHADFAAPFSVKTIQRYWVNGMAPHPPLAKEINGITWVLFRSWLGDLAAFRAGSALCFSILCGILWWHAKHVLDRWSVVAAMLAMILNPRPFFHAGTMALETIAMFFGYATVVYFWKTIEQPGWKPTIIAGILWGCALSSKNTNLLLLPVFLLWLLIWVRKAHAFRRLLLMQVFAAGTFFLLWPMLYAETPDNFVRFVRWARLSSALERVAGSAQDSGEQPKDRKTGRTFGQKSSGIKMDDFGPFPWFYGVAALGVVQPTSTVVLCVAGSIFFFWRVKNRDFALIFLGAWFPLIVSVLPFIPIYDMERLLMICIPFLALLAGFGFSTICKALSGIPALEKRAAPILLIILCLSYLGTIREWVYLHPQELSYYNAMIGGLRGATQKGFPPSYWFAGYAGVIPALNTLPANASIGSETDFMMPAYKEFGFLRSDLNPCLIRPFNSGGCEIYVSRDPILDPKVHVRQRLYTFQLHEVPLVSVFSLEK